MASFIYSYGPPGRFLTVDASGRLIATTDPAGGLYIYGYGDTGRPLVVDASGRVVLSPEGDIGAGAVGGGVGSGVSLGSGVGIFAGYDGQNRLAFNSVVEGSGISIASGVGEVTIHSHTSAYTATLASGSWIDDGAGGYYQDIAHNFNTRDIMVELYGISDYKTIIPDEIERTDANTVRITVNASGLDLRAMLLRFSS
jgi:YD repeat-containing protein